MQDIRGRFKSEGTFVMLRQPREPKDTKAIDESTDTYDTIEWLSPTYPDTTDASAWPARATAPGWRSWACSIRIRLSKRSFQQASPADMWIGDDFHHNGSFRLSYGLEYAYMMESSKEIASPSAIIDTYDTYEWYLNLGPLSNVDAKYFHGKLPTWNDFVNHPDYDAFWKRQAFAPWLNASHGADAERRRLVGSGRFLRSAQDLRTAREARYDAIRTFSSSVHGITAAGREATGRKLGRIDFGSDDVRALPHRTCWPDSWRIT